MNQITQQIEQEEQQPLFYGNNDISATEFLAMIESAAKFQKLNVADSLRLYRERPDAMFMETEEYYKQNSSYEIKEGEEGFETSDGALLYDITQTDCPEKLRQEFALPTVARGNAQDKYEQLALLCEQCGIQVLESESEDAYSPEENTIRVLSRAEPDEKLDSLCYSFAAGLVEPTTVQPPDIKQLDVYCLYVSTCLYLGAPADGLVMQEIVDKVETIGQTDKQAALMRNKRMTDMMSGRIAENIVLTRQEMPRSAAPGPMREESMPGSMAVSANFLKNV